MFITLSGCSQINDNLSLMREPVGSTKLFCGYFTECDAFSWLATENSGNR
jgi:hypothetical protein